MPDKRSVLTGRHIGLLNADRIGDHALAKLQYLLFDQLIACDLDGIIELHATSNDGNLEFGHFLLSLKKAAILIDQLDLFPEREVITTPNASFFSPEGSGPAETGWLTAKIERVRAAGADALAMEEQQRKNFPKSIATIDMKLFDQLLRPAAEAMAQWKILYHELQCDVLANNLGKIGYAPENLMSYSFDNGFPTFGKAELGRALCVAFDSIPIPLELPWNELKDLKAEPAYKRSIASFRKWSNEIVAGNTPTPVIIQEIRDSYAEMDILIKREKTRRVLGAIKFVLGNVAGFAEDIIKLRLESLASRPFTIAETLAEAYFSRPTYEGHPLYFAARLSQISAP